ncbi:uridine kinase [Anaerobacillus sp. CMMVII]|uniref:uridine kinase family protein n=1 Tax=Anaerobacillus sp. CMMVII TaxID=2755588 RepID=UPI0021B7147F|nr:uridine kinase [Anaerobacillus sp. CMMVII]
MQHDCSFEELLNQINSTVRKQKTLLIGIDGCGGSGKSTLAARIKESYQNVTIVHMDDFYLPSAQIIQSPPADKPVGADFDWKRVFKQVLDPLLKNQEGYYQRYDWPSDRLAEWHVVPIAGIVVIEGCYSLRNELATSYDLKIWVETPRETRLLRGIERDGEAARSKWENDWMVSEDIYLELQKPKQRVDIVMKGTE